MDVKVEGPSAWVTDRVPVIFVMFGREKVPGNVEAIWTEVGNVSQLMMLESPAGSHMITVLLAKAQSLAWVAGVC